MHGPSRSKEQTIGRTKFLGVAFDCLEQTEVMDQLRDRTADNGFGYLVTPNVDHIVRLAAHPEAMPQYEQAWLCLCDSKPVQVLSQTVGRKLTHVTGSDLTKAIFDHMLAPGDVITLIVARDEIGRKLAARYPELVFHWHVPPFGILDKPDAVKDVVDFIIDHPARFTFVAIGSPQSEVIVAQVQDSGRARGIALCIGASLEFITGDRARAPAWMNHSGMEWLHRIATEPRRLWKRYVFSVPPLLLLYWKELTER